ncbi:MAG: hypothetical protein AAFV38_08275, partial [Pseudomonadota bacterium]
VAPLVQRAAQDLSASVVVPELDGSTAQVRDGQQAALSSVLDVLAQRADTLEKAAVAVISMDPPTATAYTPISTADAVILYAENFVPSWAGAIAIDLLPAVLVFILMVIQGAIRAGREPVGIEDGLTLAELRAAMQGLREVEEAMDRSEPTPPEAAPHPVEAPLPLQHKAKP